MTTTPAAQLRALSAAEVLDTSARLLRTLFWSLLVRVGWVQLPFVLYRLYADLVHGYGLAWRRLFVMRPEALATPIELLVRGMPVSLIVQLSGGDMLVFLVAQLLLLAILLPFVAQIHLHGTGAFKPPRFGTPLDFLTLTPAAVVALLVSICGAYIASLLDIVMTLFTTAGLLEQPDRSFGQELLTERLPVLLTCLMLTIAVSRFQVAGPATLLEERGALDGLRRSWQLTRHSFWQTAMIVLALALLSGVLIALPSALADLLADPESLSAPALAIYGGAGLLSQLLALALFPLYVCATTVHYYSLRVRREAFDLATQLDQAEHAEAHALYQHAVEKYQRGELEAALVDFDQLLNRDARHKGALYYRVMIKNKQGDLAGALTDANRALEHYPHDPTAITNRGYIRAKLGDSAGAREDYDQALRRRPDDRQALVNSIKLRFDTTDLEGALQELEYLLTIAPSHDWALYNSACVYARWGRAEMALDRLARAIDLDDRWQATAQADSDFASLAADPRFVTLVTNAREQQAGPALEARIGGAVL